MSTRGPESSHNLEVPSPTGIPPLSVTAEAAKGALLPFFLVVGALSLLALLSLLSPVLVLLVLLLLSLALPLLLLLLLVLSLALPLLLLVLLVSLGVWWWLGLV